MFGENIVALNSENVHNKNTHCVANIVVEGGRSMNNETAKEKRMLRELELLKKHQRISVKELAETLNVSDMTVRRDLELLRKNHVLERSYGYATVVEGGDGYADDGEI